MTGHRWDRLPARSLASLPGRIRMRLASLEAGRDGAAKPVLVCALAEGADQIAARAALDLGWALRVFLPCPPDIYDASFPVAARETFDALLARAGGVEIVTPPSKTEYGYLAVGLAILANCDLLLAVHDGGVSQGEGGTHDLMDRARAAGLPVSPLRLT